MIEYQVQFVIIKRVEIIFSLKKYYKYYNNPRLITLFYICFL